MNRIKTIGCLLVAMCAARGKAQHSGEHAHCGTDEHYAHLIRNNPDEESRRQQYETRLASASKSVNRRSGVIIIPVVVHIMHNNGPENISKAQVEDALRVLNEDFRRLHADTGNTRDVFKSRAADSRIEFRLAKKDPRGRCTEGIVRYATPLTTNADDNIKLLSTWPADRYYNIWVVQNIAPRSTVQGTVLGYAQFPWSGLYRTDGIIIRHDMMGTIGTAARPVGLPYNAGRVLTHETGHWLGLFHNFQGGCSDGDGVMDTPPSLNPNYNLCAPQNLNSCRNDIPDLPDNYENFMDYASGTCQNMFTAGQADRMRTTIAIQRSMLSTSGNLDSTGVLSAPVACAPRAAFSSDFQSICTGRQVRFTDRSYQHNGGLTYKWFFQGGVPAESSDPAPVVSYPEPGMNSVTLVVSNASGSDTFTEKDFIGVMPSWLSYATVLDEGFEQALLPPNWSSFSDQNDQFVRTSSARSEGRSSMMVANQPWKRGYRYRLISDAFDVSGQAAALAFDYSFAQRPVGTSPSQDRFTVFYSTDCGQNWSAIWTRNGQNLNTVTNTPALVYDFFPPSALEWRTVTINLSAVPAQARNNVRFRFEFESAGGNNFFLDNIRLSQTAGISRHHGAELVVYPNPSGGQFSLRLPQGQQAQGAELLDMTGRLLAVWGQDELQHEAAVQVPAGVQPGNYLLKVRTEKETVTTQLRLN